MADTSYEQNIADRLRNRLDGSLLDQWGANVIEQLLAENKKLKAKSVPVEPTPGIVRAYESFDNISDFWPAMLSLLDGHLIEQAEKSSSEERNAGQSRRAENKMEQART